MKERKKDQTEEIVDNKVEEARKRYEEVMSKPMSPQEQNAEDRIRAIVDEEGHIGRETVNQICIEEGLDPLPSLD